MTEAPIEYPLVDTPAALADVIERLSGANLVAIDTEFVRERTYYPELCVLQIATPGVVAAVDCLAKPDLDPLFDLLLDADRTWLLHSARQDLEIVFYKAGRLPARLIDTQIAAGLTGFPAQIGLQALLKECLDIEIPKQHTRADWTRRPLADALCQYALDDVRYLPALWQHLDTRLEALGRRSWLDAECARQLEIPIEPDSQTLLDRVKGSGRLDGAKRAVAAALVDWRETRAKRRNRPRRWILADDQLARIADRLPQTIDELRRVPDLPAKLVAHSGAEILAAIANAEAVDQPPEIPAPDRSLVKSLQARIRQIADRLGIQPELLATRRDIALIASGHPPELLTSGWRADILAEVLAPSP